MNDRMPFEFTLVGACDATSGVKTREYFWSYSLIMLYHMPSQICNGHKFLITYITVNLLFFYWWRGFDRCWRWRSLSNNFIFLFLFFFNFFLDPFFYNRSRCGLHDFGCWGFTHKLLSCHSITAFLELAHGAFHFLHLSINLLI